MQAHGETVAAITGTVRDTARAADSMVASIGGIRDSIALVASDVGAVLAGADTVEGELSGLDRLAARFVDRIAGA
jgi:hypothetical protein